MDKVRLGSLTTDIEVTDADGRSWRQVLLADGALSLVVELRTHFVEVEVTPSERAPSKD